MPSEGSVSEWIAGLKRGESKALEELWRRYYVKLVRQAQLRLRKLPRVPADEDDVAQSVLFSVCQGAAAGKFENLQSRDDLWWLLLCVTHEKVLRVVRRELAHKRGAGRTLCETSIRPVFPSAKQFSLDLLMAETPSPDFVATLNEQGHRLIESLPNKDLRTVAIWRIEGYTVPEIAGKLRITSRSVERKLQLIRKKWSRELAHAC